MRKRGLHVIDATDGPESKALVLVIGKLRFVFRSPLVFVNAYSRRLVASTTAPKETSCHVKKLPQYKPNINGFPRTKIYLQYLVVKLADFLNVSLSWAGCGGGSCSFSAVWFSWSCC